MEFHGRFQRGVCQLTRKRVPRGSVEGQAEGQQRNAEPAYACHQTERHSDTSSLAYYLAMSDIRALIVDPLVQFYKDSAHLVKKCTKPDHKEFARIARATGIGFLIMGFVGFFVKIIHIPINNIIVGGM
eukprot:scaffold1088_cov177-Ochromonas_danica.AAC.9